MNGKFGHYEQLNESITSSSPLEVSRSQPVRVELEPKQSARLYRQPLTALVEPKD